MCIKETGDFIIKLLHRFCRVLCPSAAAEETREERGGQRHVGQFHVDGALDMVVLYVRVSLH